MRHSGEKIHHSGPGADGSLCNAGKKLDSGEIPVVHALFAVHGSGSRGDDKSREGNERGAFLGVERVWVRPSGTAGGLRKMDRSSREAGGN